MLINSQLKKLVILFLGFWVPATVGCARMVRLEKASSAQLSDTDKNRPAYDAAYRSQVSTDMAESDQASPSGGLVALGEQSLTGQAPPASASSPQDPFGRIPSEWPNDVPIHPDSEVASGGMEQDNPRLFVISLIPSSKATPAGVQSFYLERLSDWQSLEVQEVPGNRDDGPILMIIAERPSARLEVSTGMASGDFMFSLPEKEFWVREVGPQPVLIKLTYQPNP
jgi:hypothetical protein